MSRSSALLVTATVVCAFSFAACQPAAKDTSMNSAPPAAMESGAPTASASGSSHVMAEGEIKTTTETSYMSPAGEEKVGFTVYVDKDGVITDAETNVEGKAPTSVMRQKAFAAELPTVLKGKKLSELTTIDRVGGSSLTTGAFNKALADLKAQL